MDRVTAGRRRGGSFLAGVAHTGADLGPRSKLSRRFRECCSLLLFAARPWSFYRGNSAFSRSEDWPSGICLEEGLSPAQSALKV